MSFGHPDFADVRRHYYAAQIDARSGTLGANQTAQFSYAENLLGDVFVLSGFVDQGIAVEVLRNNTGVVTQGMNWAYGGDLGGNLWIPIHPTSSTMLVDIANADGVAGRTYNLKMQAFIGATVGELAQRERGQGTRQVAVAAGAVGCYTTIPCTPMFDRVTISAQQAGAFDIYRTIWQLTDPFPAAAFAGFDIPLAGGNGQAVVDVPIIGAAEAYYIHNASGVAATQRMNLRLYRGPTTT